MRRHTEFLPQLIQSKEPGSPFLLHFQKILSDDVETQTTQNSLDYFSMVNKFRVLNVPGNVVREDAVLLPSPSCEQVMMSSRWWRGCRSNRAQPGKRCKAGGKLQLQLCTFSASCISTGCLQYESKADRRRLSADGQT